MTQSGEIRTKSLKATPFHTHFLLFIRAIISLKDTIASPKKNEHDKSKLCNSDFFLKLALSIVVFFEQKDLFSNCMLISRGNQRQNEQCAIIVIGNYDSYRFLFWDGSHCNLISWIMHADNKMPIVDGWNVVVSARCSNVLIYTSTEFLWMNNR